MASAESFGALLRSYRNAAGLSQAALAEKAGLSVRGLSDLERGLRRSPQSETLRRLSAALQLEPDQQNAFAGSARTDKHISTEATLRSDARGRMRAPRRHNLPIPTTRYVARTGEITALLRRADENRLVSITGPGGSGKTRLAIEVAWRLVDRYSDGVWLVDLTPATEPSLVARSVAAALGIRDAVDGRPQDVLVEHLEAKEILLVLDKCEHLIDACADLIERLLQACESLHVMLTSREALGIPGEAIWPVPPLSFAELEDVAAGACDVVAKIVTFEAAQLFVDRARLVNPSFDVTTPNAVAVAQICKRLEGGPLAIELAAACLAWLSPPQIADGLDQRFRLLGGGRRAATSRHRTLRATMDWSFALLSDAERLLFRRLSVFAGGWSLKAAESITSDTLLEEAEILPLLKHLVAKSLVQPLDNTSASGRMADARYRFLETIRAYALECLQQSGEFDALQVRCRDWYVRFCEEAYVGLEGVEQKYWLDLLDAEHDNIRAVLQLSVTDSSGDALLRLTGALGRFWATRGHWREGMAWLKLALGRSEHASSGARARALEWLGQFEANSGNLETARNRLEESTREARAAGDRRVLSGALRKLGSMGDLAHGRTLIEEALAVSRVGDIRREIAWNLCSLAANLVNSGMTDSVEPLLQESIAVGRDCGDATPIVIAKRILGQLYTARGEYESAKVVLEQGSSLARSLDMWNQVLDIQLGDLAAAQEDWDRAEDHYRQSLRVTSLLAISGPMALTLRKYAALRARRGDFATVARILGTVHLTSAPAWNNAFNTSVTDEALAGVARQALGSARFESAWQEGEATTIQQTVARILKEHA
jgi:non-specific serine/threonine protein kinase